MVDVHDDNQKAALSISQSSGAISVAATGNWSMTGVHDVDTQLRSLESRDATAIEIDTSAVTAFDTSGAWLVERLRQACENRSIKFSHHDDEAKHQRLVEVLTESRREHADDAREQTNTGRNYLEDLGRFLAGLWQDFLTGCYLLGSSIRGRHATSGKRGGRRMISIVNQMDQMGFKAVPVIAVMSFLIGGIIAQQGAAQLKYYGEELLTVMMVGMLHFREIGVLLTSVMVAGRTGSAITAEVGTMKMREEIDALDVIGLNPIGVLIFPRLVALILVLPILTMLSNVAGILGAIVVSDISVGITPTQFLSTLRADVELENLLVGLIKAPFMALLIGLVSAVEGLKVGGSAESLGQRTTSAVVRSIFVVILVDGLFAMFFTAIDF